LVSLKTRLIGGVRYDTTDLGTERDGVRVDEKWETVKHVDDVQELERASKARSKARSLIAGVCIKTPFGLLCPECDGELLESRLSESLTVCAAHNAAAVFSKVDIWVLRGRVAADDREAVRAIFGELRDLVGELKAGIKACNVDAIRDAAGRAKALGRMLDKGQADKVNKAVDAARKVARAMVRQIDERGQAVLDSVLLEVSTKPIDDLRFAFLDLDGDGGPGDGLPAAGADLPAARGAVDLDDTGADAGGPVGFNDWVAPGLELVA
jgi:hypothetical protein